MTDRDLDRRRYPRQEFIHPIVVSMGAHSYEGYSYDLSQGGISFVLPEVIVAGPATLDLPTMKKRFQGRVLEPLPVSNGKAMRYRLEFARIIDMNEVTIMLAVHGSRAP